MKERGKKMKVITVGATKGGVGKSTIACNLAVAAAEDDKKVLLIDADVQGSSMAFRAEREKNDITCVAITNNTIHKNISQFQDFDIVIIDCGGRDGMTFRSGMLAAQNGCLIIPIEASQYSIWGTEDTLNILTDARDFGDLPAYFLFNKVPAGRSLLKEDTKEAVKTLQKQVNVGLLETNLFQRADYAKSITSGEGVIEYAPKSKAADEINALYRELKEILKLK